MFYIVALVTLVRFPLGYFAYQYLYIYPEIGKNSQTHCFVVAALLMGLAEISDVLDGWLARRLGVVSKFGKIMDPIADSFFHLLIFWAMVEMEWIPVWAFWIFVGRELISYIYRPTMLALGEEPGARKSGKWKSISYGIVQITAVVIHVGMEFAMTILIIGAVVVAIWSGIDYLKHATKILAQRLGELFLEYYPHKL